MMRLWLVAAALLAGNGEASATVVQPALGVTATEAEVGGNRGFHVLTGIGTPGTNVTDYNPAAYFGVTASSVSGSASIAQSDPRTRPALSAAPPRTWPAGNCTSSTNPAAWARG